MRLSSTLGSEGPSSQAEASTISSDIDIDFFLCIVVWERLQDLTCRLQAVIERLNWVSTEESSSCWASVGSYSERLYDDGFRSHRVVTGESLSTVIRSFGDSHWRHSKSNPSCGVIPARAPRN